MKLPVKFIALIVLMFAAPILNINGFVELKTLVGIAIGFWVGIIFSALPDGQPAQRNS